MGAESFTVLAILEARDRASEIFDKYDESLDRFSETAKAAADSARASGDAIDEALGRAVPASERLDVADARLEAAQAKAAESAKALTDAERDLLAAQKEAAAGSDEDAAAADRLILADTRLAGAQRDAAAAAKGLKDAQAGQVTALRASAAAGDESAAAQLRLRDSSDESEGRLGAMGRTAGIIAGGLAIAGAVMVRAAGNFQDSTTHLVTDAGESAKNLQMVQAGILSVSTATGQSASSITDAMYHIESGGMHGASGLSVLKVAAEGARVGGANLDDVSKALVGTLNAYGMTSGNAGKQTKMSTSLMNQLITTVGAGDMRMQDLASSLSSVAPLAASAGISFAQVGGAIATMTAQGMTAQQATQDLAHTISQLQNPNSVAIKEMQTMGLSASDVSKNIGKRGLTGTLGELTEAVTRHMGPAGLVIQSAFNSSKAAAADANTEIAAMPASLQSLARQFLAGSVSSKQWTADLQQMSPIQAKMMAQFAGTAEKAHSFNSMLTSGAPAAQTYNAAMAKMLGGTTSLKTALMLTGTHAGVFQANVEKIAASAKHAGSNVDNWGRIQSTFNFKMDSAKTAVENTGIAIGSALLPAATSILKMVTSIIEPIAEWTAKHRGLTEVIFGGVIAIAATIAIVSLMAKAYKAVTGTLETVRKALQAVGLMSKETAKTQASSADEAAAAETSAAEEGAAAQESAAAESSASWLAAAASTVGGWIAAGASMVANAAVWVAENVAKVAVVVASNVAGALISAAAWIAANAAMLLGIGLIVIAVIAAVFLIVKYWKDIEKAAVAVWHAIVDAAKAAWNGIVDAVKAVWDAIVAVFKFALHWIITIFEDFTLLGLIIKYHQDILNAIEDAWNAIVSFFRGILSDIESYFEAGWHRLLSLITTVHNAVRAVISAVWDWIEGRIRSGVHNIEAVLAWFGRLGSLFHGWWDDAVNAVADRAGAMIRFVESLPGKILHALGSVGTMLWDAGAKIVGGLIHGIESMIGGVGHAIGGIVSEIKSYLPFSPARQGPLSGAGDPSNSGRSIARNLAAGIVSGKGTVSAAARQLAGAASLGGGLAAGGLTVPSLSGAGAAGGGITIHVHAEGAQVMSDRDMNTFVEKIGKAVATRIAPQAGLRFRMG